MPGLGRYPCSQCHYVAANRRMLARHAVLIHSVKSFKCPLCPFITRYAANWYRHKRDLHGLTKVTNCEVCGFFADSTADLAQHKESEHPEHLQLDKFEEKYAKEKKRLSDNTGAGETSGESVTEVASEECAAGEDSVNGDSVTFSLPLNGHENPDDEEILVEDTSISDESGMLEEDPSDSLQPLKVKRSYNCDRCGLLTSNPREYLYHLRNIHSEKISVFECKYCIYASKHVQKLHRHCNLVHRQLIANDPDYQKQLEISKEKRARPVMNRMNMSLVSGTSQAGHRKAVQGTLNKPAVRRSQPLFKCSTCPYQTRNKTFLAHHEKTVHLKKKFYRCLQCGYYTNERARYSKHIKYHSLPKMQCEFCFFKTAYKWNMDRHMKNHENGAVGAFRCTNCNFTTSTKQSFKAHVTNHHNVPAEVCLEQSSENTDGLEESNEWEDVEENQTEDDDNFIPIDENGSLESFDVSDPKSTNDAVWKDGKVYQKNLQCNLCDFKAAWPFELRKHEENHKSQKKHPCPLCGMRFEHIAWLTKHLRRVHHENSQAKNIAAAYELLKPGRRRPGKEYTTDAVLPMFQDVLKQNNLSSTKTSDTSKGSMLSTLLNKPLQPFLPSATGKVNSTFKSKTFASISNMSRQLRMTNYYGKTLPSEAVSSPVLKTTKSVPTCNVCGYKTRWISELQRHMRVHSQEKPFHCSKCKYHCKWKGDLNRHLMKYHGIKVPSTSKKQIVPKLKLGKPSNIQSASDEWQSINKDVQDIQRNLFSSSTPIRKPDQDGPLDLTLARDAYQNGELPDSYDPYDFENFSSVPEDPIVDVETITEADSNFSFKSSLQQSREPNEDSVSSISSGKRKYQCPFCAFGTTTASRFHVHIVQHYNRRPFMCSVCSHSSNWEWDITKHIRLKNCRDKFHNKACVLLTDETGRRNYEKYDKYLVDINKPPPTVFSKPPDSNTAPLGQDTKTKPSNNSIRPAQESSPKPCSYDFRNIASNFEDIAENIVVTPDINLPDTPENMDISSNYYLNQSNMFENQTAEKEYDSKWFFCKHCNFKHATKRVVISHLSSHAGIKPFRCRACGISSNWRHVIVRHVKDAHNGYMNEVEDRLRFVQEGFGLRLLSSSASDNNINTGNIPVKTTQFGCKVCPYKCDKEFYMKFHMKQHRPREGAAYRCDYCPYFVKFKKTLVRHMLLHNSPDEAETFNEMDLEEVDNNELQTHSESLNDDFYFGDGEYSEQNDYGEDSIAISFDTLNQYSNIETISPPKVKRHICESCPYKTDNKTQYLYHKQFHRPNISAPFKCTVCSYWATMQHLLTQHMKVHAENENGQSPTKNSSSSETPEKYQIDDDWADKMTIMYVKRGDLVIKMFKCKFCPMMNKKKANVRVHQKMHGVVVNNGKFACSYCDYQCLNQGGLTNHIKIHQKVPEKEAYPSESSVISESPQKQFQEPRKNFFSYFCDKCPALFKSSGDLDIHSQFHGSSLPYPCMQCDYHARNKPHLVKHLTVHSPEYQAKRNASQKPIGTEFNTSGSDPMLEIKDIPIVKKIDQMLLLEASELNTALKKSGEAAKTLQKCVFCPAPFLKTSTLTYHISLHGSEGEYKCTQCDYAVNRLQNLSAHSHVHQKKKPIAKPRKPPLRSFPCHKCPAVFYKQDRFDRHSDLHGKGYKYACEHCDYSVRFAANLIKHKALHVPKLNTENTVSPVKIAEPISAPTQPSIENIAYTERDEGKISYICDRCPYTQKRKDAVQSHQRRHWYLDGFNCPYCDYSSMQSGFVQSHIKMHIQPNELFPAQAFMKFESFKIFCKDDDNVERLLFDDEFVFKGDHKVKKKRKAEDQNNERSKVRRLSCGSDSNSSDFSNRGKVPVVVLSDILSSEKDIEKWAPKLKIPKLKITKLSGEKIYSKLNISYSSEQILQSSLKPKPSLVVKISKVDTNNEKTMYSVSTKTDDESSFRSKLKEDYFVPETTSSPKEEIPSSTEVKIDKTASEMESDTINVPDVTIETNIDKQSSNEEVILTNGECQSPSIDTMISTVDQVIEV